MSGKIGIFTDSGSDMPSEFAKKNNLDIIPIKVIFPDTNEEFKQNVDLTDEEYFVKLADAKNHPHTATPSTGEFMEFFQKYEKEEKAEVFSISISSAISGTFNTSNLAKKTYVRKEGKLPITLYDSKQASFGVGLTAIKASSLIKQGLSSEDVVKKLDAFRDNDLKVAFAVDGLKYLMKGGRISKLKYAMGTMLSILPCLEVSSEGKLEVVDKGKSLTDSVGKVIDHAYNYFEDKSNLACYIVEGQSEDGVKEAKKILGANYPDVKIHGVIPLGGVIFTHSGPGTLEIVMFKDFEH